MLVWSAAIAVIVLIVYAILYEFAVRAADYFVERWGK